MASHTATLFPLPQLIAPGDGHDEKIIFQGQKIRRPNPRMSLGNTSCRDVQCRAYVTGEVDDLSQLPSTKVSMKEGKEYQEGVNEYLAFM